MLEQRRKAIECENMLVDILKFDGFFGANFDILKPKWIPTTACIEGIKGPKCDSENAPCKGAYSQTESGCRM